MLFLLIIPFIWAHESLPNLECNLGKETIKIAKTKNATYDVTLPGTKVQNLGKPQVKDFWDPKNKQMFDTYQFSKNGVSLLVRRPETKGPIKDKIAVWNKKDFVCK